MKDILTYEAPKADSDALVVESLGLRHIAERIVNNLYAAGYEPEENSIHPWKCLIFDAEKALETPATGAALAAIEARAKVEAIELLIGRKKRELADMHPDTHAFGMTSALIRNQIRCLESFATELREAK